MDRKRILNLVIMGLWLLIAIVLTINKNKEKDKITPLPDELSLPIVAESYQGKSFDIQRITVLRGDYFDLTMSDETRILGELTVNATENSKAKVIDLFNHSVKPRVVFLEKKPNGHWVIDFFFKQNDSDKELNLVDWLVSNKLVYK